jgi:hypothetical protein
MYPTALSSNRTCECMQEDVRCALFSRLARLRANLEKKTIKLRQAFDLGRKWIS